MFKRKLTALDYHNPNGFTSTDEAQYRNLIVWLEDQKIRHYKIEEREPLRSISRGDWDEVFQKYMEDLQCPHQPSNRNPTLDWILGYAVRLEYGDNVEKYKDVNVGETVSSDTKKSTNPMDDLDYQDPDFKAGVLSLATMLQIPPHPDHLVMMKAVCILVKEKLSREALQQLQKEGIKASKMVTLEQIELGFETPDYISKEAAKVLRLLLVRELRDLQNSANEAVVAVQGITANPKTDTKLGKVGRM